MIKTDDTDYGQLRKNLVSDISESYVVDTMLVKGVSVLREENDCNYDYRLEKAREN